jgi:hypothetical protein
VRTFRFFALMCILSLFFLSCGDDDDGGGTSGGSGEADSVVTAETASDESAPAAADAAVSTSNNIFLSAYDFNCGDNWSTRDNALALDPYTGPGSCTTSFNGQEGTYNLTLSAVNEFDGKSLYRVSINGVTIGEGEYDLSSSLGCDCPLDNWREVCPDRTQYIGLGAHNLKPGDVIEFWGDDVYPCGEHGAYAKWLGIQADKI